MQQCQLTVSHRLWGHKLQCQRSYAEPVSHLPACHDTWCDHWKCETSDAFSGPEAQLCWSYPVVHEDISAQQKQKLTAVSHWPLIQTTRSWLQQWITCCAV